jgi:hypothetical protein
LLTPDLLQRAHSPSYEESVSNKCQSRCKAKPTDSDADYTANEDSTDQDKLADDAEEAGVPGEAQAATEERGEEEEEDEAEEEEEECTASPKKAAKGAATGKAKAPPVAAPAAPVSPLFAGPRTFPFTLFLCRSNFPRFQPVIPQQSRRCRSSRSVTASLPRLPNRRS